MSSNPNEHMQHMAAMQSLQRHEDINNAGGHPEPGNIHAANQPIIPGGTPVQSINLATDNASIHLSSHSTDHLFDPTGGQGVFSQNPISQVADGPWVGNPMNMPGEVQDLTYEHAELGKLGVPEQTNADKIPSFDSSLNQQGQGH